MSPRGFIIRTPNLGRNSPALPQAKVQGVWPIEHGPFPAALFRCLNNLDDIAAVLPDSEALASVQRKGNGRAVLAFVNAHDIDSQQQFVADIDGCFLHHCAIQNTTGWRRTS
jgi:hypothetical protein